MSFKFEKYLKDVRLYAAFAIKTAILILSFPDMQIIFLKERDQTGIVYMPTRIRIGINIEIRIRDDIKTMTGHNTDYNTKMQYS